MMHCTVEEGLEESSLRSTSGGKVSHAWCRTILLNSGFPFHGMLKGVDQ